MPEEVKVKLSIIIEATNAEDQQPFAWKGSYSTEWGPISREKLSDLRRACLGAEESLVPIIGSLAR